MDFGLWTSVYGFLSSYLVHVSRSFCFFVELIVYQSGHYMFSSRPHAYQVKEKVVWCHLLVEWLTKVCLPRKCISYLKYLPIFLSNIFRRSADFLLFISPEGQISSGGGGDNI